MASSTGSGWAAALAAAAQVAGTQNYPQAALYVLATPIGNLADLSLRALHILQMADVMACEDTRHTQQMLNALGLHRPASRCLALHQHNEAQAAEQVLARLQAGERVVYVSDAGTPGVSDPGARLVAVVRGAGLRVVPVPGASSVTAVLCSAGAVDEHGEFVFAGFLSTKAAQRQQQIHALSQESRSVVILEAPHRIAAAADALAQLGERLVTVGRELTKQFEEIATVPARELPAWLAADPHRLRGEFALLVHPSPTESGPQDALTPEQSRVLQLLLAELPLKSAARLAAEITGGKKNTLYEAGLKLKAGFADD